MLQSIKNRIRPLYHSIFNRKRQGYIKSREAEMNAPYPASIYENILLKLKANKEIKLLPFNQKPSKSGPINLYLRHDIDTLKCVKNMPMMLDINLKTEMMAAVYFRVDDDEYRLKDLKDVALEYKARGFEMGLHTVCWAEDDYMGQFAMETEKFADELGFRPKSFTVHGAGALRQEERQQFYIEIDKRWDEFDYERTDCHPRFRRYHYVIEDCHLSNPDQNRFIYKDFIEVPTFFQRGKNYIILTHPCYWNPSA